MTPHIRGFRTEKERDDYCEELKKMGFHIQNKFHKKVWYYVSYTNMPLKKECAWCNPNSNVDIGVSHTICETHEKQLLEEFV